MTIDGTKSLPVVGSAIVEAELASRTNAATLKFGVYAALTRTGLTVSIPDEMRSMFANGAGAVMVGRTITVYPLPEKFPGRRVNPGRKLHLFGTDWCPMHWQPSSIGTHDESRFFGSTLCEAIVVEDGLLVSIPVNASKVMVKRPRKPAKVKQDQTPAPVPRSQISDAVRLINRFLLENDNATASVDEGRLSIEVRERFE